MNCLFCCSIDFGLQIHEQLEKKTDNSKKRMREFILNNRKTILKFLSLKQNLQLVYTTHTYILVGT